MFTTISGIVTNGVVVPTSPLPEGARVEIHIQADRRDAITHLTPGELRKLPRSERQAILATATALAEADYRGGQELTCFDA